MVMTRLGQMIMDDGEARGREQVNALTRKLLSENRVDDCLKASIDKEYQKKLMKEFGIK